jgi:tRNA threonylcarbamoyl adenosine modification protein YeaZ
MTVILSIVVCGPQLEVGLRGSSQTLASLVRLAGVSPRSTLLLAAADLLVEDAGLAPSDIGRVIISRGPGSFTGIRAGIATAQGLAAATGATIVAFDSLLVQAARCGVESEVWSAQPGRRGEVYARPYRTAPGEVPEPLGEIEIRRVDGLADGSLWSAPEALDLGGAVRAAPLRSAAESLLLLDELGAEPQPMEPLYVEGPPIHGVKLS